MIERGIAAVLLAALVLLAVPGARAAEAAEALDARELETLVAPVALYPDELLAVVLAAAKRPDQVAEAARYREALDDGQPVEADPHWHESVVALLNYPEALAKLAEDPDWTAALGAAVAGREQDVLAAVNRFRRKAYAAGNLTSDRRQRVEADSDYVRIHAADPTVIFVPYYEPALVHRPHRWRVLHYHSRPCPVYYYPYPRHHYLASQRFWGVTGAFAIGWPQGSLYFLQPDQRNHPYYGREYALRYHDYWRPRLFDRHHPPVLEPGFHRLRERSPDDFRELRWRTRDRLDARGDVPFGRPPASSGLSRRDRYRATDAMPYRPVDRGRFERRMNAPDLAPQRPPSRAAPEPPDRPSASSLRRSDRFRATGGSSRMKIRPH
ncbi:MAG TPA: DUF3300 domain-containing protein [Pseudomonadales bacterium]